MNIAAKKKIVLLGMMTKIPVAGAVWGTMQYMIGFQRLGFDVYYVEAHARTPSMLMTRDDDDSSQLAANYIESVMRQFDMEDRWAFHALHDDGRCFGMTHLQLQKLYQDAALIINYHGATVPLPEHAATGRLIYLETDPVELEIELFDNQPKTIEFLEPHAALFTWGLNFYQPDCLVPMHERFHFKISPPAIVSDLWRTNHSNAQDVFTTIGNWKQSGEVQYQGEKYTWSKHYEFLKFIDLPLRTTQLFELGLSSYEDSDLELLIRNGWRVRPSLTFSKDLDLYRTYISESRGEFTVAKDQNVRLRSGWFSERSAQYLAAGRPVITQDTGFGNILPTGSGLFAFSSMDEILAGVEAINSDYSGHCRRAAEIADEYFGYQVVLPNILREMGV